MAEKRIIPFGILESMAFGQGLADVGVRPAAPLAEDHERFTAWIRRGFHGEMSHLERHAARRLDVRDLLQGAKSVVSVVLRYPAFKGQNDSNRPRRSEATVWDAVASYARGVDYHRLLRSRLRGLISRIRALRPDVNARALVDTAPILEKAWAARTGLGVIGWNTCLIHPVFGSAVVLGEILLDLEVAQDAKSIPAAPDPCVACNGFCVSACPTNALVAPRILDARRCLSYILGESKSEIPSGLGSKIQGRLFGCDRCQEVCPRNRDLPPLREPWPDEPALRWKTVRLQDAAGLSDRDLLELFEKTPLDRLTVSQLRRNLDAAMGEFDPSIS